MNPTNPTNPAPALASSTGLTPSPVTRLLVAGQTLHTTNGAAGYAAYRIPGTAAVPYTLSGSCSAPVLWSQPPAGLGSISSSGL